MKTTIKLVFMTEQWNKKIKRLLRERKITHDRLGIAWGVKKPSVSQRLNGNSAMTVPELMIVANLLNVTMDELCRDDPLYELSSKDSLFLDKFRRSSPEEKAIILKIMDQPSSE